MIITKSNIINDNEYILAIKYINKNSSHFPNLKTRSDIINYFDISKDEYINI